MESPQHEKIQIKPLWFCDKLTYAKGIYPTDKGDVKADWNYTNNNYRLKITVPVNCTAKVYVPKCGKKGTAVKLDNREVAAVEEGNYLYLDNIGSGEHSFER